MNRKTSVNETIETETRVLLDHQAINMLSHEWNKNAGPCCVSAVLAQGKHFTDVVIMMMALDGAL